MTSHEMTIKIVQMEQQIARLVSDAESEKATRSRANHGIATAQREIEARQAKMERIIYMGLGGIAVLQFILSFRGGR